MDQMFISIDDSNEEHYENIINKVEKRSLDNKRLRRDLEMYYPVHRTDTFVLTRAGNRKYLIKISRSERIPIRRTRRSNIEKNLSLRSLEPFEDLFSQGVINPKFRYFNKLSHILFDIPIGEKEKVDK